MDNTYIARKENERKPFSRLSSRISASKLLELFQREWPEAFNSPPRPLKRGTITDIGTHNWGLIYAMRVALSAWTRRVPYLKACTSGAERFDLSGTPCGHVTEAEAAHAREVERQITEHGCPIDWDLDHVWQIRSARLLWKKL
jgi:ProP effector